MTTRRGFLGGFLGGLASLGAAPRLGWADVGAPAWLTAGMNPDGAYVLHGLSAEGVSRFEIPLPARGHAAAAHPIRPEAVAFARRPGVFALVLDCFTGEVLSRLTPPEGRQFNGHGAFSADGRLLMTSEVVAEGSAGRIGLWDAETWRRIGEWDSGGIGPHDLKRLADGRIVVANGGIQTDPTDRTMLNLESMKPNLALLSAEGEILDLMELDEELHQNSIRHLALIDEDAGVAFAMQWQGDAADPVPLLGLWRPGEAPLLCEAAPEDLFAMKGYAGSVAARGERIAISSPRGGAVMIFDRSGAPLATHRRADVCGLAALEEGFVASDGSGGLWRISAEAMEPISRHEVAWDNHMIPTTA